jgi:DNA polymerase elongation subunit (family B)
MTSKFYTNVSVVGNTVLYRGYEDGVRVQKREDFAPSLYISSNKPSGLVDIHGRTVEEMPFADIKAAKEFLKRYEEFPSTMEIHGNDKWVVQYISNLYPDGEAADYDHSLLRIVNIDIEVESENGFPDQDLAKEKINVITIRYGEKKFVMATGQFELPADPNLFQYPNLTEEELLKKFYKLIRAIDPDIITGWNVRFYDIPYIINRTIRILDGADPTDPEFRLSESKARKISPWGSIRKREVDFNFHRYQVYELSGISILDYFELYKKYVLEPRESYKLDYIAKVENVARKKSYKEYDSFKEFYTQNFQGFVEYNVQDTLVVHEIDKKRNLIALHVMMAYIAKVNYDDVFRQVRTWDAIIYNHLKAKNVVIPLAKHTDKTTKYIGAYVKDPQMGMFDWIMSFDLASLYPHLIMQYNISPDTFIGMNDAHFTVDDLLQKKVKLTESLKAADYSMAANGAMFRRDKHGFLPELMEKYYQDRKKFKKMATDAKKKYEVETDETVKAELEKTISKYDTMQHAFKIALNSAYGAVGNQHFRYFDPRLAEAITLSGQLSIRFIANAINKYLGTLTKNEGKDFVVASDTDSVYLNVRDVVELVIRGGEDKTKIVNFLDKFGNQKLSPLIDSTFKDLADYMNAYAQKMDMKREVIADRGIWKAKKCYALHVHDSEGVRYHDPKLKIMGLEVQRSSTPEVCRIALKECIRLMLTGSEQQLIDHVAKFKLDFMKTKVDEISSPRSVKDLGKYDMGDGQCKSGTPMHVRGAILFNHFVASNNLQDRFEYVRSGDKVRYVYLRKPNPIGSHVITYISKIPEAFNINKYVDRHTQYEKTFEVPLQGLCEVIGWHYEPRSSLESMF